MNVLKTRNYYARMAWWAFDILVCADPLTLDAVSNPDGKVGMHVVPDVAFKYYLNKSFGAWVRDIVCCRECAA